MFRSFAAPMVLATLFAAGCRDATAPRLPLPPRYGDQVAAAVPSGIVNVSFGSNSLALWPFTGQSFDGTPQDPINLIFPATDARAVRAALLFLNGNRTAFGLPNAAPFNCTWSDAIGGNQYAYANGDWSGSAIQLQCGEFGPIRFHVRLFPAGTWTVANVHFEVLIPGTDQHEVLSWELAEKLVAVDMMRTGLLDGAVPMMPSAAITPAPSYRTIRPEVYGMLRPELIGLVGGPAIANDGRAVIFNVAGDAAVERVVVKNDFTINYDQTVPNPICGGYIHVAGPLTFSQRVVMSKSGNLISQFHAGGMLDITPVYPAGEPFRARVNELLTNVLTDKTSLVSTIQLRIMIPPTAPFRGTLHAKISAGPAGTSSTLEVRCN